MPFISRMSIFLFMLFLFIGTETAKSEKKCSRNSINLGKLIDTLLTDYDEHLLPESEGVNVTIELHVQGVSGISEITGDFSLDVM
uniref:Neur_chan_LBD domain-containing protein n=1 Tax=Heterorhabditis bacteriophora TaxID=37862 RepID=A0A1I7XBA3_HETBA